MNNLLQMLLSNKMQQIPQNLMSQLENQLKRKNPQAFKEYQQARKDNVDPNEYLNKIVNGFNPQQKKDWDNLMQGINTQK